MHKIKSILQWMVIIVALILGFSLVKSITKIVGSDSKIADAAQKVNQLKRENERLSNELKNVQSVQFIEGEARDKLGLAKKGEIVVVLPDASTLRILAPHETEEQKTLPDPVWRKWLKLFM